MLAAVLSDELRRRGLSERAAAREIGVAHTTFGRAVRGEEVDLPTIRKIAAWLNVRPSVLVDLGVDDDASLADKIELLISSEPELKDIFQEAVERVEQQRMSPGEFRELVRYAAFRMGQSGE
jgi:transcriptional regulator with XRE-family HTH domain